MNAADRPNAGSGAAMHSVWGRVVDATGKGVPAAEVYWVAAEHAGRQSVELHETHWVALADADGRFWAPGLPAGSCLLVPDFKRVGIAGDRVSLAHATPVTMPLPEGEFVLPLPFSAQTFAMVTGHIYDETDKTAVAGHLVALLDPEGGRKFKREVLTAPDGSFNFGLLHPGTYMLALDGTEKHLDGASPPAELAGGATMKVQIGVRRRAPGPRHVVHVRVEDELALPVVGVPVQFVAPNFRTLIVATDAEGRAEASDLPTRPETVLVGVREFSPRGVFVPPGEPGVPVEVTISLHRTTLLRVAVRDAETGKPLRHANIRVSHGGGDYWNWGGVLPPPGAPQPDHHDIFVLPGHVTVRAESPGYVGVRQEVEVVAGEDAPVVTFELVSLPGSPSTVRTVRAVDREGARTWPDLFGRCCVAAPSLATVQVAFRARRLASAEDLSPIRARTSGKGH
jgi:hypothetical protein